MPEWQLTNTELVCTTVYRCGVTTGLKQEVWSHASQIHLLEKNIKPRRGGLVPVKFTRWKTILNHGGTVPCQSNSPAEKEYQIMEGWSHANLLKRNIQI